MNYIYRLISLLLWPVMWFYSPLRLRSSVLLVYKSEVLCVKHQLGSRRWTLPGGGVKLSESSLQTAIREINEELGFKLDSSKGRILNENFIVTYKRGLMTRHQFVYFKLDQKPEITTSHEILDYKWFSKSDIESPEISKALSLIAN